MTPTSATLKPLSKLQIGAALALAGIISLVIFLPPSSLEVSSTSQAPLPLSQLIEQSPVTLAPGIPTGRVPEYSIEGFNYSSTQSGKKQWNMQAKRAFLFNEQKLVHAREVTVYLYGADEQTTVVTAQESKFLMNERDIEFYGQVITRQPDGFYTESEYLRYLPNKRLMLIPQKYPVKGGGQASENSNDTFSFRSRGMEFSLATSKIDLPLNVETRMVKQPTPESGGVPEITTITSDHCLIDRNIQIAHYRMFPHRRDAARFVRINQPGLFAKGRRADLHYGEMSSPLQYLVAEENVYFEEFSTIPPTKKNEPVPLLRYGTAGRAEFNSVRSIIELKEFPQVYQDNDTVTGDTILIYRDTDTVEVKYSNAFSSGQQ